MKTTRDNYDFSQKSTSGLSGFEIFSKLDPIRYYFHFNGANGDAILFSQSYTTSQGRDKGVISLAKNLLVASHYEIKTHKDKFFFIVRAGNHQELTQSRFFSTREEMLESMEFIKRFYAGEEDATVDTNKEVLKSEKIKKEEVPSAKHAFRIDIYMEENGMKGKMEHLLTKEKITFSELDADEIITFIEYKLKENNNTITNDNSLVLEDADAGSIVEGEEILEKEELILQSSGAVPPAVVDTEELENEIEKTTISTPPLSTKIQDPMTPLVGFKAEDINMKIVRGDKIIRRGLNKFNTEPAKIVLEFPPEISCRKPFLNVYYYFKKLSTGKKVLESNFQQQLNPNHPTIIPFMTTEIPMGTYQLCVQTKVGMSFQDLEGNDFKRLKHTLCVFELEEAVSKKLVNSF